jgi:hypothetical protein
MRVVIGSVVRLGFPSARTIPRFSGGWVCRRKAGWSRNRHKLVTAGLPDHLPAAPE